MTTINIVNVTGIILAAVEAQDTRDALQQLVARRANLYGADLYGANLYGAKLGDLPPFQICPQEGAFIGYKKVLTSHGDHVMLTLEIQADAQRTSSLVGRKCRASAVKVLAASNHADEVLHSIYDYDFTERAAGSPRALAVGI